MNRTLTRKRVKFKCPKCGSTRLPVMVIQDICEMRHLITGLSKDGYDLVTISEPIGNTDSMIHPHTIKYQFNCRACHIPIKNGSGLITNISDMITFLKEMTINPQKEE